MPHDWIQLMKASMRTVNAEFNTNRMVEDYTERYYIPCLENALRLGQEDFAKAKDLASWRRMITAGWSGVTIECVDATTANAQPMGTSLPVSATLQLGGIPPEDVLVEAFHGLVDPAGNIEEGEATTLFPEEPLGDGLMIFSGTIACRRAGLRGFTVRVTPRKDGYPLDRFETGLVTWWDESGGRICPIRRKPAGVAAQPQ